MSAEESAERIYAILRQALSPDTPQRQHAESALRDAEEQQDFFSSLAMITTASGDTVESQVRWLAAVCAKNAVSRSWRRRAHRNAVTEEERAYVVSVLLGALGEPSSTIATQISVWLARVARVDFPSKCPSLLGDLCDALGADDGGVVLHAVITLDMVLKQLASRRLASDRRALVQVAPKLFAILCRLFVGNLDVLVTGQREEREMTRSFHIVERCMKSFKKLLSYACERIRDFEDVPVVFSKLLEVPDLFMKGASGGTEVQLRLSLLAAKLVLTTQERHPVDFQMFLSAFMEVYYKTLIAFDSKVSGDRICYYGAAFLTNVVQCPAYGTNSSATGAVQQSSLAGSEISEGATPAACRSIVLSFFDVDKVNVIIEVMISKIFVLTGRELETWANDPEALVQEEEAAEWGTESLRRACEDFFKIMLIRDKTRIVPMVLHLTESVPTDKPLLLDACYRAVGRAVYDVQGAFQFETWLRGRLGTVLQADSGANLGERIIQARAVWLVGQFAEQLTRESRQAVNPLLVRLMSLADGDLVVSLTATKAVQTLVEDIGFHAGDFAPHLQTCLLSCFRLVCIAEMLETKRYVMGATLSFLQRFPSRYLIPHVDLVAASLPELWEQGSLGARPGGIAAGTSHVGNGVGGNAVDSGEANLLRTAIVSILACMIRKVGAISLQSEKVRQLVFPVIEFSVDLSSGKGGTFMMEDGCDLWGAVIASSTEYTSELAKLYPRTESILGVDFDNLREVFRIMDGYILLGKERFMHEYGASMLQTLGRAMDSVKDRGCLAAVEILDLLLQCFPGESVRYMSHILQMAMVKLCARSESQVMGSAYAGLLARACLSSIEDVEKLILRGDEARAVDFLDALIESIDSLYRLPRRKLGVLAICGLCTRYSRNALVQQRTPQVLNALVQVLTEEQRQSERARLRDVPGGNDFEGMLARFGEDGDTHETDAEGRPCEAVSAEDTRRAQLRDGDIVQRLDMRDACGELFAALRSAGEERYSAAVQATDGRVLQQLEALMRAA